MRDAGELVACLPHLVGFCPLESVVVVGLRHRSVVVTARADLPDRPAPSDAVAELVDGLVRGTAHAVDSVLVVVWSRIWSPGDALVLCEVARGAYGAMGRRTMAAVHTDGVWWCDAFAPERERALVPDTAAVPAAVAAVFRGSVPAADRAAVVNRLAAPANPHQRAVHRRVALDRPVPPERAAAAARAVLLGGPAAPSARETAHFLLACQDLAFRDAVLSWLMPETWQPDDGPMMRRLVRELGSSSVTAPVASAESVEQALVDAAVVCPPTQCAPIMSLLATYLWGRGAGALAVVACERALDADPTYRLARLVSSALRAGVRPPRRRPALAP